MFGLLAAGILFKEFPNKFIKWSAWLFISGICLFSGSLYFLTYIKGTEMPGYGWVGAVTPFGGLCFIFGWIFLFVGISKHQESYR